MPKALSLIQLTVYSHCVHVCVCWCLAWGYRLSSRCPWGDWRQYHCIAGKKLYLRFTAMIDCKHCLNMYYSMLHLTQSAATSSIPCVFVCCQVEELIKEVQVLREELRSRDKTIAQLTLQCQQLQQHQREQMVSWCEQVVTRQVKRVLYIVWTEIQV